MQLVLTIERDGIVIKAVRVLISGKVQGVGYRAWVLEQAKERGLSGWVRNRKDGTVEALFYGDENKVDDMVDSCYQGPSLSRVEHIHRSNVVAAAVTEDITTKGFILWPTT